LLSAIAHKDKFGSLERVHDGLNAPELSFCWLLHEGVNQMPFPVVFELSR
jgi:hypothetical protein